MHTWYQRIFSDQVMFDMKKGGSAEGWLKACSYNVKTWFDDSVAHLEKLLIVGNINANILDSRRKKRKLAYFSPKPVASLTGAQEATDKTIEALDKYVAKAKQLIPEFERALETESGTTRLAEFIALCADARDIASEMAGRINVFAIELGEVHKGEC